MFIKKTLLLYLAALQCNFSFSQIKENGDDYCSYFSNMYQDTKHVYTKTINRNWAQSDKSRTYENQGEWHSEYLCLNPDFTFEFRGYYEGGGETYSFGMWSKQKRILTLNSDKEKTLNNSIGRSVRIKNWLLFENKDSLITKRFTGDRRKTITYIDSLVKVTDHQQLLVQVDTNNLYDSRGYVVGYFYDSSFFNQDHELVKFVSASSVLNNSSAQQRGRQIIYFLPSLYFKSFYQSYNGSISSLFYFEDQKLINASEDGVDTVFSNITFFKKFIEFGKPFRRGL